MVEVVGGGCVIPSLAITARGRALLGTVNATISGRSTVSKPKLQHRSSCLGGEALSPVPATQAPAHFDARRKGCRVAQDANACHSDEAGDTWHLDRPKAKAFTKEVLGDAPDECVARDRASGPCRCSVTSRSAFSSANRGRSSSRHAGRRPIDAAGLFRTLFPHARWSNKQFL